jgi:uncharacterized protein (TIRG00374 family)
MDVIETPAVSGSPLASLPEPAPTERASQSLGFRLNWRVLLGLAAGLVLGLLLLPLAARGARLDQVWSQLSQARPGWVTLSALSVLLTTAAKIARWRALLPATRRPSLRRLGQALLIGKSLNALLPARLGDLARIYVAGDTQQISKAALLGTLGAEKAFDTLFFLISGGLALALVPLPAWLNVPLVAGTATGFLVVVLALAWPQNPIVPAFKRWIARLPWKWSAWLGRFVDRALSGLAALRNPGMAGRAGLWSAVIWALAAGTNALLFVAFKMQLGPQAALVLLVVLYAGVAPPTSPGRLGVFHTLTVLTLQALGIDRAPGLAYATALHAIVYLPEILPGAILLGLRLAEDKNIRVRKWARRRAPSSNPPNEGDETTR